MSTDDAHILSRAFPPAPEADFQMPFHYLLYAEAGALRLAAEGRQWSLPAARAALIAANQPIRIALPQKVQACSALFAPGFAATPDATLSVFEVTPLLRELLARLRHIGADTALDADSRILFQALATEAWRLARTPSPTAMPQPRTELMRRALMLTEENLETGLAFSDLAGELAITPRTLSRRFTDEIGMTWRDTQRRLRMIRAIEMMAQGNKPVTEVALSVGYTSLSAFNAAFRSLTGQTPTAYRAGIDRSR